MGFGCSRGTFDPRGPLYGGATRGGRTSSRVPGTPVSAACRLAANRRDRAPLHRGAARNRAGARGASPSRRRARWLAPRTLSHRDVDLVEMAADRVVVVAVVEDHDLAVAPEPAGEAHDAIADRAPARRSGAAKSMPLRKVSVPNSLRPRDRRAPRRAPRPVGRGRRVAREGGPRGSGTSRGACCRCASVSSSARAAASSSASAAGAAAIPPELRAAAAGPPVRARLRWRGGRAGRRPPPASPRPPARSSAPSRAQPALPGSVAGAAGPGRGAAEGATRARAPRAGSPRRTAPPRAELPRLVERRRAGAEGCGCGRAGARCARRSASTRPSSARASAASRRAAAASRSRASRAWSVSSSVSRTPRSCFSKASIRSRWDSMARRSTSSSAARGSASARPCAARASSSAAATAPRRLTRAGPGGGRPRSRVARAARPPRRAPRSRSR